MNTEHYFKVYLLQKQFQDCNFYTKFNRQCICHIKAIWNTNESQHAPLNGGITDMKSLLSVDYILDVIGCQSTLEENVSSIDIFNTHETNITIKFSL